MMSVKEEERVLHRRDPAGTGTGVTLAASSVLDKGLVHG